MATLFNFFMILLSRKAAVACDTSKWKRVCWRAHAWTPDRHGTKIIVPHAPRTRPVFRGRAAAGARSLLRGSDISRPLESCFSACAGIPPRPAERDAGHDPIRQGNPAHQPRRGDAAFL